MKDSDGAILGVKGKHPLAAGRQGDPGESGTGMRSQVFKRLQYFLANAKAAQGFIPTVRGEENLSGWMHHDLVRSRGRHRSIVGSSNFFAKNVRWPGSAICVERQDVQGTTTGRSNDHLRAIGSNAGVGGASRREGEVLRVEEPQSAGRAVCCPGADCSAWKILPHLGCVKRIQHRQRGMPLQMR